MKLNKKQKEEFQHYAEKYAKELKNIFTYESSEKYLKLQAEYKWSAFCIHNLIRYNVFGDVEEDDLIEDESLKRKYEKIVLPIFRQNVLELKNEKTEREKEERKRAKEESEKKDKQPRKKRKSK